MTGEITDEEFRAIIAELTNMTADVEEIIKKFKLICHRAGCPDRYGLINKTDICDQWDCFNCWLKALRHD